VENFSPVDRTLQGALAPRLKPIFRRAGNYAVHSLLDSRTARSRIGCKASRSLHTSMRVSRTCFHSSRDNCACVEVVRVIESAAPSASPVLPHFA